MLSALIIVLFLLLLLYLSWKYFKIVDQSPFVEPPANFIAGHAFHIDSLSNILSTVSVLFQKHGRNFKWRLGPSICPFYVCYITCDYKMVEGIVTNGRLLKKSTNYTFFKSWLGDSLLLSDGELWKRQRKFLTPAFHFEILKEFVSVYESVGDALVEKLMGYVGEENFELHQVVTLATLDVICETAMGTKINALNGENTEYVKSVQDMCFVALDRCLSPFRIFKATYWLTPHYYKEKRLLKVLHNFSRGMIKQKKEEGLSESNKNQKVAFLDLMLKYSREGGSFSDQEIREEVDTFMFAGHDTTASAICFILFCLSENQDVQEKVFTEQMKLFGNEKNPTVAYADLQNMKYLDNVIKETFRLYPPVPILGRKSVGNVSIGDFIVPANSEIVISVYNLHRDPEYFPEPEKFDPDRFNTLDNSTPYAYIPFSAGQRNCIGQRFALLEVKSIVSKIIRYFKIKATVPRHQLKLTVEAVLKSQSGICIRLERRR